MSIQNPSMTRLSTSGTTEPDRISEWTHYLATYIDNASDQSKSSGQVLCEPIGKDTFSGELESGNLGCLKLNRVKTSPYRFRRKQNTYVASQSDPLILIIQLTGISSLNTPHLSKMLEPGGMLIFDTRNIFDIAHIEHSEQLVITIPRNSLAMADGAIYTYGHNFDNERGLSKLLYEMLRQSVDSYGLLTTASRMSIGQSILHLLPNILCPTNAGDDSHLGSAGIIIQGIKSYIEQNLTDPSLTIEKIAEENNCSVRSVHRIFKMTDMGSVSHYIWNRRVTSAANVLADPGHLSRSITDIAFSFGFSSSAHFSRTFKSYYGITPREHRNTTYLMNQ